MTESEFFAEMSEQSRVKMTTARTLWLPAVNNHGGFGRWDFVEIANPLGCAKPYL